MASFAPRVPPPAASGWAGLPRDVLWSVFTELGQREILSGAGLACVAWRRLARNEPALWRRIDLTAPDDGTVEDDDEEDLSDDEENMFSLLDDDLPDRIPICQEKIPAEDCDGSSGWKAMALAAVDRSAGQCEAFWGRADDELLLYLADRASSIKSLRVTSCYDVSSEVFTELIKKFSALEELELVLKSDAYNYTTKAEQPSTNSWVELFQSACEACSHLNCFTVRHVGKERRSDSYYQSEPRIQTRFSIPIMHGLHSLELFGDSFTADVVMQIADKCPSLKFLDIRDVPYLHRDETELRTKCSRIKDLRLPAEYYDSDSDVDGGCFCFEW